MIKICVSILDMTSRCYFGKMNLILGSVVPLAMFGKEIFAYFRVLAAMIPSFGAKKAAPAFQVKKALTTGNNSSIASIKNLSDGSTPGNPTTATSIETTAPLTTSSTSGANLPQQVPHLRQAEAGEEDFEKENIVVNPKNKKQAGKAKKPKAKKDPDAPKRPLSAYMFFSAQVLSPLKASLKLNSCQVYRNAKK